MKSKKLRNSILALSLVAVVGIGGTLAYLSSETNTETNTFTMGPGITGETEEPNWDPENGVDFVPGKVIAKDPQIHNTSAADSDPAYVAAKIKYQVQDAEGKWVDTTYEDLDQFINIKTGDQYGFNTEFWEMADGNTTAYYKGNAQNGGKLAGQTTTEKIFTDVEIDKLGLTPEQVASADTETCMFDTSKYNTTDKDGNVIGSYTTYTMKDFQIVVTGYMVQSSGFDSCQAAMQDAFPNVFK